MVDFVIQVQTFSQGPALSGASSSPVLHPRTLILTSTDVFLLDEDYVSYPLPDFAKEPPSRWACWTSEPWSLTGLVSKGQLLTAAEREDTDGSSDPIDL